MNKKKEKNDSEHYEIIDYQNIIKKSDVKKVERHLYQIDKFRINILQAIVDAFDWYGDGKIGEPIVLEILYDSKKRVKEMIALMEVEIPEIADTEFVLLGELKRGGTILISKDFDHTSKIQNDRKESIKKWERQLNDNLSLSLGQLLIDLENLISKVQNLGTYPDIRDWYPQLENIRDQKENNSDPTLKEKWHWIESEYQENRESFGTDDEWAEEAAEKFQITFDTRDKPSPSSMKRYGKYGGRY